MVVQLSEYTKNHWSVYFKWVNFILCELYLSKTDIDVCGDFPGGAGVKNPPANSGDTGSIPGPRRSHMPQSN